MQLGYHLTYAYKVNKDEPFISASHNNEIDIFDDLIKWNKELTFHYRDKYLLQIIILSILSINFGVKDDSRNTFKNILIEAEKKEKLGNFIEELLKWINRFEKTIYEIDIDYSGKSTEEILNILTESANIKEGEKIIRKRIKEEEEERKAVIACEAIKRDYKIRRKQEMMQQKLEEEEAQRQSKLKIHSKAKEQTQCELKKPIKDFIAKYKKIGDKPFLSENLDKTPERFLSQDYIDDLTKLHDYFSPANNDQKQINELKKQKNIDKLKLDLKINIKTLNTFMNPIYAIK